MRRISILIILIGTLYTSCNTSPEPIPINKMTKLLLEMHLAEAYAQHMPKDSGQTSIKNEDSLLIYNAQILKANNITEKDFQNSINWYKTKPELLDSIYQTMLTDITILQSKVNQ